MSKVLREVEVWQQPSALLVAFLLQPLATVKSAQTGSRSQRFNTGTIQAPSAG